MSEGADISTLPEAGAADIFESIPTIVFENRTTLSALHFNTVDQYDQAFHVFVVRQAFDLGKCNEAGEAALNEPSVPAELEVEDRYFAGEDGSVACESDLAPFKPRCDVIVNGTAHAPGGKPVREFLVRLMLEAGGEVLIDKTLNISGERWFKQSAVVSRAAGKAVRLGTLGAVRANPWSETTPTPFLSLPLRYEDALGGTARIPRSHPGAKHVPREKRIAGEAEDIVHEVSEENPLGKGFAPAWYLQAVKPEAVAAPRISYAGNAFSASDFWACANGKKLPKTAGFGAIGRAWLPRRSLVGTFESKTTWGEDEVPRLPADFDYGYWNCAPVDQQCRFLRYGETFTLHNLRRPDPPSVRLNAAQGSVLRFVLPLQAFFLLAANEKGEVQYRNLSIDTVWIDTDVGRVTLVWRALLDADGRFSAVRLMHIKRADQIERLDAAEAAGIVTFEPATKVDGVGDG